MYESDVDDMFDITEARNALMEKRNDLLAECDANSKLQRRFDQINSQLRSSVAADPASKGAAEDADLDLSDYGDDGEDSDYRSGGRGSGGGSAGSSSSSTSYRGSTRAQQQREDEYGDYETRQQGPSKPFRPSQAQQWEDEGENVDTNNARDAAPKRGTSSNSNNNIMDDYDGDVTNEYGGQGDGINTTGGDRRRAARPRNTVAEEADSSENNSKNDANIEAEFDRNRGRRGGNTRGLSPNNQRQRVPDVVSSIPRV